MADDPGLADGDQDASRVDVGVELGARVLGEREQRAQGFAIAGVLLEADRAAGGGGEVACGMRAMDVLEGDSLWTV